MQKDRKHGNQVALTRTAEYWTISRDWQPKRWNWVDESGTDGIKSRWAPKESAIVPFTGKAYRGILIILFD